MKFMLGLRSEAGKVLAYCASIGVECHYMPQPKSNTTGIISVRATSRQLADIVNFASSHNIQMESEQ